MNGFPKNSRRPVRTLLARGISCALAAAALAAAADAQAFAGAPQGPAAINLAYQGRTLGGVADDIRRQSGIEIKLPAELAGDPVSRAAHANTWADAVKTLLSGYNYVGRSGENGKLSHVTITGRNGNGPDAPRPSAAARQAGDVFAYQPAPRRLPEKYRGYREGSVSPVEIPFARLHALKIGEKASISLPSGQYEVVHDNAFTHKNGDKTWIGYLDQEGKEYRVVMTSGKNGGVGQILTPDGEYQIDLENGVNYLVNVTASGLTHGSLEDDQAVSDPSDSYDWFSGTVLGRPESAAHMDAAGAKPTAQSTTDTTGTATAAAADTTAGACDTTGPIIVNGVDKCSTVVPSVIDVLVLYTPGMNTSSLDTRLNQLVALTNQAYLDSKIVMSIRLVGKQLVSYTETNSNTTALRDMTYGSGVFSNVATLRKSVGADLVTLLRPFYYTAQTNCGYAWINGSGGMALSASKGFAAVSDGSDRGGTAYYCNNYTFAHEIGHTLGNVHERGANAPTAGAYPFSYGWGVSGTVGTIMSYLRPLVAVFANPKVTCNGLSCGVPTTEANSADNAATTNLTGGTVAKFMTTVVP